MLSFKEEKKTRQTRDRDKDNARLSKEKRRRRIRAEGRNKGRHVTVILGRSFCIGAWRAIRQDYINYWARLLEIRVIGWLAGLVGWNGY